MLSESRCIIIFPRQREARRRCTDTLRARSLHFYISRDVSEISTRTQRKSSAGKRRRGGCDFRASAEAPRAVGSQETAGFSGAPSGEKSGEAAVRVLAASRIF